MIVKEKIAPKYLKAIKVVYEGSGNPADDHKIVGIELLDAEGHVRMIVGQSPEDAIDDVFHSKEV